MGEQLIVKVDAVSHNNNGGAVQGFLKQMGIEHHGKRLAAALRVPKHATFAVCACGYDRAFNSLAHSEILMISRQNLYRLLRIAGEQNKVFQNIQQPGFLEHSLIESIKLDSRVVLILSIFTFPLHKAVKPGGDRSGLVGGKVADYADGVVIEQGWNILHIVADLIVSVLCAHFVLGGTFQFHQNQRKTVDKQNNVRAAVVAALQKGKLIHHIKGVVLHILIVYQTDNRGAFFALFKKLYRNTVLQIVHKDHVFLHKAATVEVFKFGDGFLYGIRWQGFVQPRKAVAQFVVQQGAGIVPVHIRGIDMGVAHIFK